MELAREFFRDDSGSLHPRYRVVEYESEDGIISYHIRDEFDGELWERKFDRSEQATAFLSSDQSEMSLFLARWGSGGVVDLLDEYLDLSHRNPTLAPLSQLAQACGVR